MWNSLTVCVLSCFCLQVLRFNVEARTWTPIGKLQHGRYLHAIAEANLNALCPPVGNLNPSIKRKQTHQYHYHQGAMCPNLFKSVIGNPKGKVQNKKIEKKTNKC